MCHFFIKLKQTCCICKSFSFFKNLSPVIRKKLSFSLVNRRNFCKKRLLLLVIEVVVGRGVDGVVPGRITVPVGSVLVGRVCNWRPVLDGNAIFAVTAGLVAGPVLGDVVSALQVFGSSSGGTLRRNGMVVCPLSSMSRFSNLSDVLKRMSTFVK